MTDSTLRILKIIFGTLSLITLLTSVALRMIKAQDIRQRHDRFTSTDRVEMSPQVIFEQDNQTVTLTAYYDPAEAQRLINDPDIPVSVQLEFTFPSKHAPAYQFKPQVTFSLTDGGHDRSPP